MPQQETFRPLLQSLDVELAPTEALLLTTKLMLPVVRPGTLLRQRLIERVSASTQRRVTLVSAPAGFGKTSLLSTWASQQATPVAWVSLDEGDNDPVRFWSYICTALEDAFPGVGAEALALLRVPQSIALERALTLLLNAVATVPQPLTLILDDCHTVTAPPIYQSLAFVIDHLPTQLHLVLAGRVNPPLPLARLRVRGELAEIRVDQLRFTVDEAVALLRETLARDLPPAEVVALADRTEGWAAGLALAALSLQGQPDSAGFVTSLRGSDRFILDYLVDEVLARQSPVVQQFLLHTSILDRLCAEVCDSLWRLDDLAPPEIDERGSTSGSRVLHAQEMLEYLEQANLFTIALDREQHWYRYHQLFAEFLRARLQRTYPERVAALHRRAAAWYEQADMYADAVSHTLMLGDAEWTAALVDRATEPLVQRGELATLLGWLEALPTSAVLARPRLCLAYALALATSFRFDEAEHWLTPVAQAQVDADMATSLQGEVVAIRAIMAALRGDVAATLTLARAAIARLPFHNALLQSAIACIFALGYLWNEHVSSEDRAYIATVLNNPAADGAALTLRGAYGMASLRTLQGRLREAAALYREILAMHVEGVRPPPLVSLVYSGLSAILFEQNDLPGARRAAQAGIELGKAWGTNRMVIDNMLMLARVQHAQGDAQSACTLVEQAAQCGRQTHVFPWFVQLVSAERARLDLAEGRVSAAERWAHDYERFAAQPQSAVPVPPMRRAAMELTLARVHLAHRRLDAAQQVLVEVRQSAETNEWRGLLVEAGVLEALVAQAHGNEERAVALLTRALTMAAPEGYVRVFVDTGQPIRTLLTTVEAEGRIAPEYVALLLAALPESPPHPVSAAALPVNSSVAAIALAEALSERELEVLRLLTAGLSNHDVADRLIISVATVKTHIINIYSKLQVHSRTQAVARAHELHLV